MCCNLDCYLFEEDDPFVHENKNFLRKTMLLLYVILFIYLLLFYYVNKYIL